MRSTSSLRLRTLGIAAVLTAAALPAAAGAAPATQAEIDTAVQNGAGWVVNQQGRTTTGAPGGATNGSLPGFQGNWVITSLAAAGINAADVQNPGVTQSLQDWQQGTYPGSYATLPNTNSAGAFGREALISSSAGIQVTKVTQDLNMTASLASRWRKANGDFGAFAPNSDGFALLATNSLFLPKGVRQKIVANLLAAQKTSTTPDAQGRTAVGGWSFTAGATGNGDIDMTGAVLSMVCQEGMTPADAPVAKGIDFLKRRLNPTTGGFGVANENSIPPNNLPSAGWALIGLKACGVDPQSAEWTTPNDQNPVKFILGLQRLSGTNTNPGEVGYGSFKYAPTTAYPAGGTDMNSAEVAVRALSNFRWSAPAPVRANPTNPRLRPAPTVTDGTTVPIALSVDAGDGDVRFCAVRIPSGAPLTDVLTAAKAASIPTGCVDDFTTSKGVVTSVNGKTLPPGARWQVRFQASAPQLAGTQAVRFGGVVALEVGTPVAAPAPVTFAEQPQSTISAARTVTFTAGQDAIDVARASITGTHVSDFLVTRDGCAEATLNTNDTCSIDIRFAPGEAGARAAAVRLIGAGGQPVSADVALTGTGGALPKGDTGAPGTPGTNGAPGASGTQGTPGSDGANGTDGADGSNGTNGADGKNGAPGVAGATGPAGPAGLAGAKGDRGNRGPEGADAAVRCRLVRGSASRITCTVSGENATNRTVRARLTRHGRTYATGTVRRTRTELRRTSGRRLVAGSYTLRVGAGRQASALKVVVPR
ncbi:hypothetical protein [Patulibacter minatonensis]|uniref:hypothetical protein n=1 Tax=Patulibacter minatonensis TaxID=298163 RepID=UPI0004AC6B9A|nr:hypothetical protein [Patulibacter minatonensis]